ncbi:MAG: hypothetical protein FD123_2885 [Bacteroidetes bacterium]|nr:MAG: hypothetical protein FD123_2885 [Bacteroidota bacterium]
MRTILFSLLILFSAKLSAQYGPQPPFTVELEPVVTLNPLPGMHSFAFAKSGSKWLFVGGRINGLHGFSTNDNFAVEYANYNVIVIDTVSWQYYTSPLTGLAQGIADPLTSTNMQYVHNGNYLYMTGGFGWDSTTNRYVTYPTLTAIDVNNMISAVMSGGNIATHIRQIVDTNLRVCGGEMYMLNGRYHLLFGHDFRGRYSDPPIPTFTQVYTRQIRSFDIVDDGVNLSVANYFTMTDTNNFHRRDLNVGPILLPGAVPALEAYSGVFQKGIDLPWPSPIVFDGTATVMDSSFTQQFSNYTCPLLPVFDSVHESMYTVFFGGMSWYDYNPQSGLPVYDSLVPFVSDISCVIRDAAGNHAEGVLPEQMPGLKGSNAKFVWNDSAAHFSNDVLDIRSLSGRTLAGYIVGGIRSDAPNRPNITFAHDTVYRVYITPDQVLLNAKKTDAVEFLRVFPNPAKEQVCVRIKLQNPSPLHLQLFDMQGRMVREEKIAQASGQHDYFLSLKNVAAGSYRLQITGKDFRKVEQVGVIR